MLQPTKITGETSSIIDNIYGKNVEYESISGNILTQFAHHLSQFLSIHKVIRLKPNDIYECAL